MRRLEARGEGKRTVRAKRTFSLCSARVPLESSRRNTILKKVGPKGFCNNTLEARRPGHATPHAQPARLDPKTKNHRAGGTGEPKRDGPPRPTLRRFEHSPTARLKQYVQTNCFPKCELLQRPFNLEDCCFVLTGFELDCLVCGKRWP